MFEGLNSLFTETLKRSLYSENNINFVSGLVFFKSKQLLIMDFEEILRQIENYKKVTNLLPNAIILNEYDVKKEELKKDDRGIYVYITKATCVFGLKIYKTKDIQQGTFKVTHEIF